MTYTQTSKKKKIDELAKTKENFDHILFNINRFHKVKVIDESIFYDKKDEGMQLFDKFKQLTIQLAEEEE